MLEVRREGLSDKQIAFVEAFASGKSASEAAMIAGYNTAAGGYAALKSRAVQAALHDYRDRLIRTEGATLAYNTMISLMKPGNPGGVRIQAAKYMLDAAGHGPRDESGHVKELHEMSAEELEVALARIDSALAGKAEAAKPVNGRVIEG